MNWVEKINVIIIEPSDLDRFRDQNIWEIAWAIAFWDKDKSVLPQSLPSIFSHSGYRNEDLRFIDVNEQWPIQIFTIESASELAFWVFKNIKYSESKEFVVWSLEIDEVRDNDGDELIRITENAYNEVYEFLQKCWKTTFVRIWNYVTDILWETTIIIDWEKIVTNRYKAFCTGRSLSLDNVFKLDPKLLPTATGIWNHMEKKWLKLFFIATNRSDIQNHKNPKQTNPADYDINLHGIKQIKWQASVPKFNRATTIDGNNMLFIWGTASILWQEVVYEWNVVKQTRQTLQNIKYTMEEAKFNTWIDFMIFPVILKVFIKNKTDFDAVKLIIENNSNPLPNVIIDVIYTYGDICRDKWLVEISCETMSLHVAKIILERKLHRTRKIETSLAKKIFKLWFSPE